MLRYFSGYTKNHVYVTAAAALFWLSGNASYVTGSS